MLVSPLDWSLIETWKQRGIPLRVALRGITQSFDAYDQQPRKYGRTVNSLFYCQPAVEEAYQQYLESHVGGQPQNGNGHSEEESDADSISSTAATPYSATNIKLSLHEWRETLTRLSINFADDILLAEAFDRAARRLDEIDNDLNRPSDDFLGQLDSDLNLIEGFLLEAIRQHAGEEKLAMLKTDGEKNLKNYRKGMEKEVYEQTLENWIARKLREEYRVPRLSLFYL